MSELKQQISKSLSETWWDGFMAGGIMMAVLIVILVMTVQGAWR